MSVRAPASLSTGKDSVLGRCLHIELKFRELYNPSMEFKLYDVIAIYMGNEIENSEFPHLPSPAEIKFWNQKWRNLDKYVAQEKSLEWLFKRYPQNCEMNEVLVKVATLDRFYSTNVLNQFDAAKHIVNLNIDERLSNSELGLVNEIAGAKINGKPREIYSFATKYCSHHYPKKYPIYDSFAASMLIYFIRSDISLQHLKNHNLRDYSKYYDVMSQFKNRYGLGKYSLKEIDRYLWLSGKHYFP